MPRSLHDLLRRSFLPLWPLCGVVGVVRFPLQEAVDFGLCPNFQPILLTRWLTDDRLSGLAVAGWETMRDSHVVQRFPKVFFPPIFSPTDTRKFVEV